MTIKPNKRAVYEWYYGSKDWCGQKIKKGTRVKFYWAGEERYYFDRESGEGRLIAIDKGDFTKHFIPAAK
jgi:hypothetical protein